LVSHCRSHPDLDAVALSLAHAAVERHHEVVGIRARVDPAADLGDPQLDAVVNQQWERQTELVAVEGAGWLAYHDGASMSGRARMRLMAKIDVVTTPATTASRTENWRKPTWNSVSS
jgi:hypothetical protein